MSNPVIKGLKATWKFVTQGFSSPLDERFVRVSRFKHQKYISVTVKDRRKA